MAKQSEKTLSLKDAEKLITVLKARFEKNKEAQKEVEWIKVEAKIKSNPKKLWALNEMEKSGGEPALVSFDKKKNEYLFIDCSAESPQGRRSLCYDRTALESRKEHKPKNNVLDVISEMGAELLTEEEYRDLQKRGAFDLKTSSWIKTPDAIRKLGGALFCDRRYNTVFVYHNGAESYYAARGFRACIRI